MFEEVNILREFILGVVQGLTEFLPISSSGHLALFSKIMNIPSDIALFAFLHLATFLVVVIFLWSDVWSLLVGLLKLNNEAWQLTFKIIISSVPAAFVGIFFESKIEKTFSSQLVIGLFFLVTAITLWFSDRFSGSKTLSTISYVDAVIIGLFQAFAILPGISRSGFTIFGALLIGMTRTDALKYSFLLSLPVTLGAGLLELKHVTLTLTTLSGFGGAIAAGLAALWLVKSLTLSAHLKLFSIYLILPAVLSFLLNLIK